MSAAASASSSATAGPTSEIHSTRHLFPSADKRLKAPQKLAPNDWILPPTTAITMLYFYRLPSTWSSSSSTNESFMNAQRMGDALEKLLDAYPVLQGKFAAGPKGTWEVAPSETGVPFSVASTKASLSDLPITADSYLTTSSLPVGLRLVVPFNYMDPLKQPPFEAQVTRFACGSVCLGIHFHHFVADGEAFFTLIKDWASLYASNGPASSLNPQPTLDREWITPTEEQITERLKDHVEIGHFVPAPAPWVPGPPNTCKIFRFTPAQLQRLKQDLSPPKESDKWISTFEAMVAFFQRQIYIARRGGSVESALAAAKEDVATKKDNWRLDGTETPFTTKLAMATNWRKRVKDCKPKYFGNAALYTPFLINPVELVSTSAAEHALRLHEALIQNDEKHLKGTMAWIASQPNRAAIKPNFDLSRDFAITQWNKMGMYETYFEKDVAPERICFPHFPGMDGIVILMGTPPTASTSSSSSGAASPTSPLSADSEAAIDVHIGLEVKAMEILEASPEFQRYRQ